MQLPWTPLMTALLLAGCSGSVTSPVVGGECTVGATEACACPNDFPGVEVCGPSGTFLHCLCPVMTADAGKGPGPRVDAGHGDTGHPKVSDATIVDAPSADVTGVDGSVCVNGQRSCGAETPETCENGQWVLASAPCAAPDAVCFNGACVECSPGAVQCAATGQTAQRCSTSGQWETLETCTGATPECQAGACVCPSLDTLCGGACVDTRSDPAHCGSCSATCDYTCSAGTCTPRELVSNTGALGLGIAANGENVYWLTGITGAALDTCPVTGCPAAGPTQVAANISPAGQFGNMLGLTGENVYWPNGTAIDDALLTTGAATSTFATTGSPFQLVVDTTNVYWTDTRGIYSCPLGVTCTSPTTLVDLSVVPDGGTAATAATIAVDTSYVYWSDSLGNINSHPLHGGATVVVAVSQSPNAIIALGGVVYWTGANGLFRCAAGTPCTPTALYTESTTVFSNLATDGTTLYWTTGESPGAVRKCPIASSCAAPTTMADGIDTPSYIAVDNQHTYWLAGQTIGTVYEFEK